MTATSSLWVICATIALAAGVAAPTLAQDPRTASADDLAPGRAAFIASCARCHGVRGGGGEGPPLARAALPRAPDDASLIGLIQNGIPGSAMSDTWWLSEDEVRQVVRYVRSLAPSGPTNVEAVSGDPVRGRELFQSEGCDRCHTVGGNGGGRGPELTTVGLRRGPSFLRESILDPAAQLPHGLTAMPSDFADYLVVRVIDADGTEIRGMRMNEDSYTIQLKDARGTLHSFYKARLRTLDKEPDRSMMRSYRNTFSAAEIDDLVAYLATLTGVRPRGVS